MKAPLRTALVLAFLALPGAGAAAQFAAPSTVVRTSPAMPARGTVVWLQVEDDWSRNDQPRLLGVEGEAAGEPLHFTPGAERGFVTLLGIPLEGGDTLPISLRLTRPERVDSTTMLVAVRRPAYRREKLTVAPRMVQYDSATRVRIECEQALALQVSRRSHQTPRLWEEPMLPPRRSRITSAFGGSREFNGRVASRHLGTDLAGAVGEPVVAPARGVVALVADFYLAGRAVYLDHGAGLTTGYFHLSQVGVAEGDTVAAGQPIGAVGRTGRVTGPHLHWIMRYGRITVDPMSLVRVEPETGIAEAGSR